MSKSYKKSRSEQYANEKLHDKTFLVQKKRELQQQQAMESMELYKYLKLKGEVE